MSWQKAGRVANFAFGKVMPVLGAAVDYGTGKSEGEDDIRAAVGAAGSGAGGVIGGSIGTLGGPVGTFVGANVGSFLGGWGADRIDDFIRGKNAGIKNKNNNNVAQTSNNGSKKMSQIVQLENGDVAEVDDNNNIIGWVVKGGMLAAGAEGLYQTYKGLNNAVNHYNFWKNEPGIPPQQAAASAWRQVPKFITNSLGKSKTAKFFGAMPTWAKVATGVLVADQLTGGHGAGLVTRAFAGGADATANAVGVPTDFDARNPQSQQAIAQDNEQERIDKNKTLIDPYNQAIYDKGFRNREEMEAYEKELWERNNKEAERVFRIKDDIARRNYLTDFEATQARDLLKAYAEMPESVARSIAAIYQAT